MKPQNAKHYTKNHKTFDCCCNAEMIDSAVKTFVDEVKPDGKIFYTDDEIQQVLWHNSIILSIDELNAAYELITENIQNETALNA